MKVNGSVKLSVHLGVDFETDAVSVDDNGNAHIDDAEQLFNDWINSLDDDKGYVISVKEDTYQYESCNIDVVEDQD